MSGFSLSAFIASLHFSWSFLGNEEENDNQSADIITPLTSRFPAFSLSKLFHENFYCFFFSFSSGLPFQRRVINSAAKSAKQPERALSLELGLQNLSGH